MSREVIIRDKINLEGNFNTPDPNRNAFMLKDALAEEGYDWWWHSFTGHHAETGEERAFFIEFFTINPALGGDAPILGQLPANKTMGLKPSYLMVKAGAWGSGKCQLHRFFGWNEVSVQKTVPYMISADDCFCSETETTGHIFISEEDAYQHPEWMCDAGSMSWKLKIHKQVAFNVGYGAGKVLRDLHAFEMYWHAQGMKTAYEGEIWFNGEKYLVTEDTSYGYADKNWGSNFTSPWVWISSNRIRSRITGEWLKDTVFDIGGGRPKIGHISLEGKLLSAMWYEGEPYEFNFSKLWTLTKTEFHCEETEEQIIWHVVQTTPIARMETDLTCEKKDMLLVNYEAPDGSKKHNRLWNGGNGIGRVKLYKKEILFEKEHLGHHLELDSAQHEPLGQHPEHDSAQYEHIELYSGKYISRNWVLVDDMDVFNAGCEYGEYQDETLL